MSVLIKGMKMPEHCGYCRFRYDGICHALQKTQYVATDCPLIDVPDHGDLLGTIPSAEPKWIPIKTRPMDEEERAYWSDQLGYDIEYEDAVMFDCKMPDDGNEILVSYGKWVNMDKCEIDGGLYGLEENGDWDGVTAWMPLPEPYKGGDSPCT